MHMTRGGGNKEERVRALRRAECAVWFPGTLTNDQQLRANLDVPPLALFVSDLSVVTLAKDTK